jgi:hypothetical protein
MQQIISSAEELLLLPKGFTAKPPTSPQHAQLLLSLQAFH